MGTNEPESNPGAGGVAKESGGFMGLVFMLRVHRWSWGRLTITGDADESAAP